MLFEFITRLLSLDIAWLAALVMDNLFFLFAFAAMAQMFFGRRIIAGIMLISLYCWAWITFNAITGTVIIVGGYFMLSYMTRLAAVSFAESNSWLKNKLVLVTSIQGIIIFLVYNFFMR